MIKQLLNSVIAKYRDLSVFAQPRPIIVNYYTIMQTSHECISMMWQIQ